MNEGSPGPVELIEKKEMVLLINTPLGTNAQYEDYLIRRKVLDNRIPYTTTLSATKCFVDAIRILKENDLGVKSITRAG